MLAFPPFLAPAAFYARLLNALLQREDWARSRLYPHAGKTVRFVAGPVRLSLCIDSSGYTQASNAAIVPDVTLTIPSDQITQLPSLIKSQDPSALVAILHIEGDAGLAQTVSDLARDLRWDIEHELASRVGDAAAMRILQTGSVLFSTARSSTRHLTENISEYLAYESNLLVSRPAYTGWADTLNDVQQRLAQLEARVNALPHPAAGNTQTAKNKHASSTTRSKQGHDHV